MTANKADKQGGVVKPATPASRRRFVVMWTANRQDRRSAPMTEQESETFAARLRVEKAENVRIETDEGPIIRGTGR